MQLFTHFLVFFLHFIIIYSKYCLLNYYGNKNQNNRKCPICNEILISPFHSSHDVEIICSIVLKSFSDLEQIKYFERLKEYDVELSKMGYSVENMIKLNDEEEKESSENKMDEDINENDGYESSASVDSTLPDE